MRFSSLSDRQKYYWFASNYGKGDPLSTYDPLLVYRLTSGVDDAILPNKVGTSREDLGGEVFPGRALAFDGVDQYASVADNGDLDIAEASTDFCFGGYVKTGSDVTTVQRICGKSISNTNTGRYEFLLLSGSIYIQITTSTGNAIASHPVLTNTEYHVATRIDVANSRLYFYVDGTLINSGGTVFTGTFANVPNSYEFMFGASNDSGGTGYTDYAECQLRDIRIYHKDVTSDLSDWMKGEQLGDEVAWWFCEDGDSGYVHDAVGGYHMTTANFDSGSFVEGMWQSLYNKYGYAIDVTGNELTENGDFNDSSVWNLDADWAISGGTLNATSAIGRASHPIFIIAGRTYIVQYEIVDYDSGTVRFLLGGAGSSTGSGNGVFTESIVSVSNTQLQFDGLISFTGSIDNVSVKQYFSTPIPLNMNDTSQDIFGNASVYVGQAKYNAISRDAAKFVGDGTAYFTVTGLLTTDAITSLSTDEPTCTTNGRLDVASGDEVWGVTITRAGETWAYYPICEGSGSTVYDVSGNGNHLTGVNVTNSNWGVIDLPDEDYLAENGVTVVEYDGDTQLVPFLSTGVSQYDDVSPVLNAAETYEDYKQNGSNLIPGTSYSMPENIVEIYNADENGYFYDVLEAANTIEANDTLSTGYDAGIWYVDPVNYNNLIIFDEDADLDADQLADILEKTNNE